MNPSNPKVIYWGIIGLGKIAHKFAEDLLTLDHAQLYAVASRDLNKANNFKVNYKAQKAYGNYEDLAKDPAIDAVYIATPHSFHKAHTTLCLTHKKAVLCEKPFAMNLNEVEEMIECAKANGTLLMEALWTYFLPHYRYLLNTIQNRTFGLLQRIEADFGFHPTYDLNSRVFNKSLGGGSLLDIGIYPIFVALSTLGKPEDIEATATFFENEVDSSCSMRFYYNKDLKARLNCTFLKETPTEAIFYFDNAIIQLNSRFHEPTTITIKNDEGEKTLDFNCTTNGYAYEIAHFNQLIRDQKTESDLMTFNFSKTLIKTLDQVRETIGLTY
ncbi:MAG: Gfo/Idh/MocA family oxidoreductase [Bacteroidia bacterium]|nr:Gfo/Idh/MocA family oxidoreductase [Bacteroidia bacterium]